MWPVSGSATIFSLHIIFFCHIVGLGMQIDKEDYKQQLPHNQSLPLRLWAERCLWGLLTFIYILVFYMEQVLPFWTFFVSSCSCLMNWILVWCLVNLLLLVIWVWFPPSVGVDLQAFLLYKCRVYTFLALVWSKCRNKMLFNFYAKYLVVSRLRSVW